MSKFAVCQHCRSANAVGHDLAGFCLAQLSVAAIMRRKPDAKSQLSVRSQSEAQRVSNAIVPVSQ